MVFLSYSPTSMLILVTNDDGIEARGIQSLVKGLKGLKQCRVVVVAPDREQSTRSHSLTLHRPLRILQKGKDTYAIDGTPTDCVAISCAKILQTLPDLIVSGINRGGNLGDDVHYSGTVSAAMEGGLKGIPSIAISQLGKETFRYETAVKFAVKIVKAVRRNGLPPSVVLNVNVPTNCRSLEFELTKTGKRDYGEVCIERFDLKGRPYYWIGGDKYEFRDIRSSDCNTIVKGKISVTPLLVNVTDENFLKKMRSWKW